MKLPTDLHFANQSTPGATLLSEPPFASAAANTPAIAEPDVRGLPLSATWFLYSGLSRSANDLGGFLTRFPLYPIVTEPQESPIQSPRVSLIARGIVG